ncbi:MAG: TRAP transporter substrate-binding protein [Salinarimonas sp.]|nr:TRAP transporter substrate-binding protein [Salinarimonas sp.]
MKNLLAGTAIVAIAGIVAVGTPTTAQSQEFNLTFQSTWPSADPHHHNFERWAAEVEKNTNGRVVVETLPAGAVVPAFEVLDAVSDQVIDGGHAWSGYWVGKDRASVMVSSGPGGPFGMDAIDYWGWQWNGGGLEVNNDFFQNVLGADVFWMPAGSSGPQSFGWYNVDLSSADDLEGLRLRIPGIPGEMYGDMGMSIITLPGGEIVPAGERGVIDAAEFVNPYHDEALGFEDVWSIHYAPAYHETVTVMEILFNKEIWDSIPEDLQNIIKVTTQAHHIYWETHKMTENRNAMERLQEAGVEFRRTPDDILERSLDSWHRILEAEYNVNPAFKAIADHQLAYAERNVVARRILEPDWKAIADVYWAPGGLVESGIFDIEYTAPDYYTRFQPE